MWIDSHAHIMNNDLFEDFDTIVENAKKNAVKKILIICGNMQEVNRALANVENNSMFDLAIGVHPGDVVEISDDEYNEMMSYLDHPQVVALGEIGLDYYWSTEYKGLQNKRFKQQIDLANKHDLPIIIHMRSSKEDILQTLTEYPVNKKGEVGS